MYPCSTKLQILEHFRVWFTDPPMQQRSHLSLAFIIAPGAAPTMLTASNITATSVILSWEPPESDLQNGVIRHYLIQVFETQTGNNLTYQATAHTVFTVADLHPFYTYSFSVQAVTVAAGPLSLPQSVRTLEDGK